MSPAMAVTLAASKDRFSMGVSLIKRGASIGGGRQNTTGFRQLSEL
jgi:hypothetical protein